MFATARAPVNDPSVYAAIMTSSALVHHDRMQRAARAAAERGLDALLITPSEDYAYLLGYRAPAMERLTCLIVPAEGEPVLVLPRLEEPLARHELARLADELQIVPWDETDDPVQVVRSFVNGALRVGVQDQMWARFALHLRAALDPAELLPAGPTMSGLRRTKSAEELALLRAAASAADAAMSIITSEQLSGRVESEVSRRIRELLIEAGHDDAGFAIVASGPNSASPHHAAGPRMIDAGDAIVLDIGGTIGGYCSDTSRTCFVGEPPAEFAELYEVLRQAQSAACRAVRPGISGAELDAVARGIITEAGYGEAFLHRTGHGIGLQTHEEPYIVASNPEPLVEGNAFSIEPGIYIRDRWGARIEDIVICTADGGERLNTSSTQLYRVA